MNAPLTKEELRLARLKKLDPSGSDGAVNSSSCCKVACDGGNLNNQSPKNIGSSKSTPSQVKSKQLTFGARIATLPKNCSASR